MEQEAVARDRNKLYSELRDARLRLRELERGWSGGSCGSLERCRRYIERLEVKLGIKES